MSLTEKVDQSETISEARVYADADHWDRLEDWKNFDDLAQKNLETVVYKLLTDKVKTLQIIQDAYRRSFQLMRMQSDLSVQESVLNHLNDVQFCKMRELRKNDRGIGLDHKLENVTLFRQHLVGSRLYRKYSIFTCQNPTQTPHCQLPFFRNNFSNYVTNFGSELKTTFTENIYVFQELLQLTTIKGDVPPHFNSVQFQPSTTPFRT